MDNLISDQHPLCGEACAVDSGGKIRAAQPQPERNDLWIPFSAFRAPRGLTAEPLGVPGNGRGTQRHRGEAGAALPSGIHGCGRRSPCHAGETHHLRTCPLKVSYTATFQSNSEFDVARSRSKRIGLRFACAVLLLTCTLAVTIRIIHAQEAPTEYQVKAAHLFNFLKFVE